MLGEITSGGVGGGVEKGRWRRMETKKKWSCECVGVEKGVEVMCWVEVTHLQE